jgi:hypothetical protein
VRIPAGFELAELPGARIVARPGTTGFVTDAVAGAGSLYAFAREAGGDALRGRTAAFALATPAGDWVVRHYVRGGAVAAPLLGDRYARLGEPRPVREADVSDRVRARGVATPEVRAFVLYPAGPFYRADIATVRIPDARDLADLSLGPDRDDESERVEAWRAAGRLLRAAFDAGLVHPDLNLRNVLVAGGGSGGGGVGGDGSGGGGMRGYLLDLDGARLVQRVSPRHVHMMLQRLHRSRLKLERQYGTTTDVAALTAFGETLDG